MNSLQKKQLSHLENAKNAPKRSFTERALGAEIYRVPTLANTAPKSTPLAEQIVRIEKYLQQHPDKTISEDELKKKHKELEFHNEKLINTLRGNQKIYLEKNFVTGKYNLQYKPTTELRNIDQLRAYLRERRYKGIEINSISDSYPTIREDIETLQQQREIIVVEAKARKKSKSRTTIFFNEQEHDLVAAPELKERLRDMWTDISMPQTEFTLIEALNSRGITPTIEEKRIEAPTVSMKKTRKKSVKKITNKHMDGIEDSMIQNQKREHLEKLQANAK